MYSTEIKLEHGESSTILDSQESNPESFLRKVKTEAVEEEQDIKSQLATTIAPKRRARKRSALKISTLKRSTRLAVKNNRISKNGGPKFKVAKRRGRPPKQNKERPSKFTMVENIIAKRRIGRPRKYITAEETAPQREERLAKSNTEEIISKRKGRPQKSILKKRERPPSFSSSNSSIISTERTAKRIITPSTKLIEQIEENEEEYISFITENYSHYCVMCDYPINTEANYELHMKEVHNTTTTLPPDPYSDSLCCTLCTTTFPSKYLYQKHLWESHDIGCKPPKAKRRRRKRRWVVSKQKTRTSSRVLVSPPPTASASPPPSRTSLSPSRTSLSSSRTSLSSSRTSLSPSRTSLSPSRTSLSSSRTSLSLSRISLSSSRTSLSSSRTSLSPSRTSLSSSRTSISPSTPFTQISTKERTLADVNNTEYYCGRCEFTYSSIHHFKTHMRRIHKVKNYYSTPLKHNIVYPSLLPSSVGSTDCYCKACQMKLPSNLVYRLHLREVHDMRKVTVNHIKSRFNYIQNSGFRCNSCDEYFSDKTSFLSHMSKIHLSASFDLYWPKGCIDEHLEYKFNLNLYCTLCAKFFLTAKKFQNHAKFEHKILSVEKFVPVEKEQLPDLYDPFSFCKVCKTTFSNREIYLVHLDTRHSMDKETGNIRRHCSTCNITFRDSYMLINHFRRHPYNKRGMVGSSSNYTGNTESPGSNHAATNMKEEQELLLLSLFPSIFDPNFYCKPCDTTFESHLIFKYHLNTQHYISLEKKAKERLCHCTPCQRLFICEQYFINHNSNIHGISSRMSKKMIVQPTNTLSSSDTTIICTLCNKASFSQRQHARHFKIAHASKFTVCKTCELTFIPTKQSIQYNAAKKGCKAHSHGIPSHEKSGGCIITDVL